MKIHEQNCNFKSSSPIRYVNHINNFINNKSNNPIVDYINEPEMSYINDLNQNNYYLNNGNCILQNNEISTATELSSKNINSINKSINKTTKKPFINNRSPIFHQQKVQREFLSPLSTTSISDTLSNQNINESNFLSNSNCNSSNASVTSFNPFYEQYYNSSDSISQNSRSNSTTPIFNKQKQILVIVFFI